MRQFAALLCAIVLAFFCCNLAFAEEGVLVIQVTDTSGRPISGVVLSAAGDSSVSGPTDAAGRAIIRVAPNTQAGDAVTLHIVRAPKDLVLISPWNGRIIVPPFNNISQNVITVVLAGRRSRILLENERQQLLTDVSGAEDRLEDADKSKAVDILAKAYGLSPKEVERALRTWVKKRKNVRKR